MTTLKYYVPRKIRIYSLIATLIILIANFFSLLFFFPITQGWINSAINPFIYAFYSADFRLAFWRLTCRFCTPNNRRFDSNLQTAERNAANQQGISAVIQTTLPSWRRQTSRRRTWNRPSLAVSFTREPDNQPSVVCDTRGVLE